MLLAEMKVMATYRQKEERDLDEDGKKEIDELPNRIMYAISSFHRHGNSMFLSYIETCIPLRPEHSMNLSVITS